MMLMTNIAEDIENLITLMRQFQNEDGAFTLLERTKFNKWREEENSMVSDTKMTDMASAPSLNQNPPQSKTHFKVVDFAP